MVKNPKSKKSQGKVEARPVLESLREPEYPLSTEIGSPNSHWGKAAAGAATFFLAMNIGGVGESRTVLIPPPLVQPPQVETQQAPVEPRAQNPNAVIVAPLFDHGEGRGATGCVVVTPPVFLSEEEAMQIIKEELGKHGIKLGAGGELKDVVVEMPLVGVFPNRMGGPVQKKTDDPKPLDADAIDPEKKIVVEFVSKDDHEKLRAPARARMSMTTYDVRKVAQNLTEAATGKGESPRYLGVFYDPMAKLSFEGGPSLPGRFRVPMPDSEKDKAKPEEGAESEKKKPTLEERTETAQKETKKLLREQVGDFAEWLEKQGVKLSKETEEKK